MAVDKKSLLVITQKVDRADDNLGSFHEWLRRLSFETVKLTVICLQKGECDLPDNVEILSLGKEKGVSRLKYILRFYWYIISRHRKYDGVFVHMNQMYVILGSFFWKLWKKPILLWYVHRSVTWQLRLAEKLVNRIFTTSPESFRLPSQKIEIVGHGINVEAFKPVDTLCFQPLRLITVGRITESKDLETLIRAADLVGKELPVSSCILTIAGVPIRPDDQVYLEKIKVLVKQLGAQEGVIFAGKKRYDELPAVLRSQSVFVHASKTGSVDKAVLEALATALPVVSSSEAFCRDSEKTGIIVFDEQNPEALAQIIEKIYHSGILTPNQKGREYVVKNHNLTTLVDRIITYFIAATNI